MKHYTGLYPEVRVDQRGVGSVSQAGAVLLLETIRATDLDGELRAALARWRKPTAVHDPAKILVTWDPAGHRPDQSTPRLAVPS